MPSYCIAAAQMNANIKAFGVNNVLLFTNMNMYNSKWIQFDQFTPITNIFVLLKNPLKLFWSNQTKHVIAQTIIISRYCVFSTDS